MSTLSITLELSGNMRSTPCPKLILRTVKLACGPRLRAITTPSKACRRSLSPSLIFTCTRIVSPALNSGRSVRFCLERSLSMIGFDMMLILPLRTSHMEFIVPKDFSPEQSRVPRNADSPAVQATRNNKFTCLKSRSAILYLPHSAVPDPANLADCAASFPAPNDAASGECRRDYRKPGPRGLSSRENPPAACSADNPANRRSRKSNLAVWIEHSRRSHHPRRSPHYKTILAGSTLRFQPRP